MTIGDTDVVPGEGGQDNLPPYGFLARLIGLPVLEARLALLISINAADKAALTEALVKLRVADTTVDAIEPPPPFNHTK